MEASTANLAFHPVPKSVPASRVQEEDRDERCEPAKALASPNREKSLLLMRNHKA